MDSWLKEQKLLWFFEKKGFAPLQWIAGLGNFDISARPNAEIMIQAAQKAGMRLRTFTDQTWLREGTSVTLRASNFAALQGMELFENPGLKALLLEKNVRRVEQAA